MAAITAAAKLTARQFRALYAISVGDFVITTSHGITAHGHVGENGFTTTLLASDYAALKAAGLIVQHESGFWPGQLGVYANEAGRALLARNRVRSNEARMLLASDAGQAMHRRLRGLPR